ncbi:MAG: DUF2959 family protein, partial [Planctomycetota bacterium]
FLPGCQYFEKKTRGPKQVNDLVGSIELVYAESEVARERAMVAVGSLQKLAANDLGEDPAETFAEFVDLLERSEEQAEQLRATIGPMKEAAAPIFRQWRNDIRAFNNEKMRERSEARFDLTRERYDAILAALESAQEKYDAVNKSMRDHALFLSHDFNHDSIDMVKDDVKDVGAVATELDSKLDACMEAARIYVEATALPVTASMQREEVAASAGSEEDSNRDADRR